MRETFGGRRKKFGQLGSSTHRNYKQGWKGDVSQGVYDNDCDDVLSQELPLEKFLVRRALGSAKPRRVKRPDWL